MPRRKQTAAEYIEANALLVPLILGDMIERLGHAAQEWSLAVWAVRAGDLDNALTHVVEVGIAVDVPLRVGRAELRSIADRVGHRLDSELPNEEERAPADAEERRRFTVTAEPDGAFWLLRVDELPELVTQARFAREIEYMARDLIALSQEISPSSFDLVVPGVDDRRISPS